MIEILFITAIIFINCTLILIVISLSLAEKSARRYDLISSYSMLRYSRYFILSALITGLSFILFNIDRLNHLKNHELIFQCHIVLLTLCVIGVLKYISGIYRLYRLINAAVYERKFGAIHLLYSDQVNTACNFMLMTKCYIVLPVYCVENHDAHFLTIKHEVQHIRQQDGLWMHLLAWVSIFCWWNPSYILLKHWCQQIQEICCDTAVLNSKKFGLKHYASTLLEILKERTQQTVSHRNYSENIRNSSLLNRMFYLLHKKSCGSEKRRWLWLRLTSISIISMFFGLWAMNSMAAVLIKNYPQTSIQRHSYNREHF